MGLAIGGVIANLFGSLTFYSIWLEKQELAQNYYYQSAESGVWYAAFIISLLFWGLSLLGLILALISKKSKAGPVLIIIGSVYFVPLGLIGIFGGRKLMQPMQDIDIEARRKALNKCKDNSDIDHDDIIN